MAVLKKVCACLSAKDRDNSLIDIPLFSFSHYLLVEMTQLIYLNDFINFWFQAIVSETQLQAQVVISFALFFK